ncbi:hypothetical protein CFR74_13055 [Novacetimonas hansenii]|nr:hypothetical protein CFR74_13055 [Novacetimonas hansenii]
MDDSTNAFIMVKLTPQDIIASAAIPDFPGAYVLGCYDTRITLYSQQVRALELAYSLSRGHYVSSSSHIAVIGGGAGGLTMAAALALQGAQKIHLFERARELMPLQRQSVRRQIDPHIYNWPAPGADNEEAELPILDWKSGPARDVRATLLQQYNDIGTAVDGRLVTRCDNSVMSITSNGSAFEITFERDAANGERETSRLTVDMVVLAIGFGIESPRPIAGISTQTYWLDSGVPDGYVDGQPRPSVAISGNGDGGLIDLVAAASQDFDHHAMIQLITKHPNVNRLFVPLAQIDKTARNADARGTGFDFIAAYDAAIGDIVDDLGLTDEIERSILPGIQIYLLTRNSEVLSTKTATLNRLAVYLVKRACDRRTRENFTHLVSQNVTLFGQPSLAAGGAPPSIGPEALTWSLDCDGQRVDVDRVVVRRGPNNNYVRLPFANMLHNYPAAHDSWVARFPEAAIAPVLSSEARSYFIEQAKVNKLPQTWRRSGAASTSAKQRIKLALYDGDARWSGDVSIDQTANVWDTNLPLTSITILAVPQQLGSLVYAISRLALHAPGCVMHVDVARWQEFLNGLTIASRNAEDLEMPTLRPVEGSSELAPITLAIEDIADRLNQAMDRKCLHIIDDHIRGLLERSADPSYMADLTPAHDVTDAMLASWNTWYACFEDDPDLLARYLRLLVCAKDSADAACEAQTLVGPRKKKLLIRATAAALAVAAGWAGITPHLREPGNLTRVAAKPGPRDHTGHVCAAERIDGRALAMEAAGFLWRTDFVLLPMMTSPIAVALRAEERFDMLKDIDRNFAGDVPPPSLMLSVDPGFQAAVSLGLPEVSAWLTRAEATHRAAISGSIEAGDEGAPNTEEATA